MNHHVETPRHEPQATVQCFLIQVFSSSSSILQMGVSGVSLRGLGDPSKMQVVLFVPFKTAGTSKRQIQIVSISNLLAHEGMVVGKHFFHV